MLLCTTALAAGEFIDTVDHPHEQYIEQLRASGIVQGYGYGIFRPDININRAEFLKILMLAVYGEESFQSQNQQCFTDFVGGEQWYWSHACTAKQRGVISGYPDGTFQGVRNVNLAEALKIAIEAWGIPIPENVYAPDFWYIPYFEVAAERGLFNYFPNNGAYKLTRSDMAYLIVAMGEPIQEIPIPEPMFPPEPPPPPSSSSSTSYVPPPGPTICGNGTLETGEECDDGNLENSDGCSRLCIIVDEPVYHGALRIEQRPVSASMLSPGVEDVVVFAFDAIAGRQDVGITRIALRAQTGNLALAQQYTLYFDDNGDGIAEKEWTTAESDGDLLTFTGLNLGVQEGMAIRFEIRADIRSSVGSGEFSLEFALDDSLFIQAVGIQDGRDLTGIELNGGACTESSVCWIVVSTIENPVFQIVGRGNLYVTAATLPVQSQLLLGGTTSDDLLRLTFRAEGEDIEVRKLVFQGEESVFNNLLLYPEGSTFPAETVWGTSCEPTVSDQYCANTSFIVPKDTEATYTVRGVVKSDQQGIVSGSTASVQLDTGGVQAVEARGEESQEDLDQNDGDSNAEGEVLIGVASPGSDQSIDGPTGDVVLAKIDGITNINSDPDQSLVPTGTHSFAAFRFSAAPNVNVQDGRNTATINKLVFTVDATNIQFLANSFSLYNTLDTSKTSACTASADTGQFEVTCDSLDTSDVSTVIEQGATVDLALRGFITNAHVGAGGSILQASLQELSNRSSQNTIEWTDEVATFGWVDVGESVVRSTVYVR